MGGYHITGIMNCIPNFALLRVLGVGGDDFFEKCLKKGLQSWGKFDIIGGVYSKSAFRPLHKKKRKRGTWLRSL